MPAPLNDLTGQRFGRLTVLERGEDYIAPPNFTTGIRGRSPRWVCQCDCGNRVSVIAQSLTIGRTKSCGCLRIEKLRERRRRNHEGTNVNLT